MRLLNIYKQTFLTACCTLLCVQISAAQPPIAEENANKIINQIYHNLNNKPILDMPTRIEMISSKFLGAPYLLSALGEGMHGDYDQFPLYRADAFDCQTYVDTVLAIALADSLNHFNQCLTHVRYHNGHVSFIERNHFTCLDWNQNNQRQGFIKDITTTFRDQNNHSVVKFARSLIDKPAWYSHKSTDTIRLNNADSVAQAKHLGSLKHEGAQLARATSIIPYVPLTALFDPTGSANMHLFNQIPNAAIIEIIRPNWDLEQSIGTHLNVSHLGFAIWHKNTLFFREASSDYGHVIDVPLIAYLHSALKSPTIKGINIQIVLPQQSQMNRCGIVSALGSVDN